MLLGGCQRGWRHGDHRGISSNRPRQGSRHMLQTPALTASPGRTHAPLIRARITDGVKLLCYCFSITQIKVFRRLEWVLVNLPQLESPFLSETHKQINTWGSNDHNSGDKRAAKGDSAASKLEFEEQLNCLVNPSTVTNKQKNLTSKGGINKKINSANVPITAADS